MREIKFRAWEKQQKVMYESESIEWIDFGTKRILLRDEDFEGDMLIPRHFKKIELMQFTGLKDKNGKEVWEGDKGWDINDDFYEIKFVDGCFVAVMNGDVIVDLSEVAEDIEVIGNIYENPELLK